MLIPHRPHTDAAQAVLDGIAGRPTPIGEQYDAAMTTAHHALAAIPALPIPQPWIDPRAIVALSQRARHGLGDAATSSWSTTTWIAVGFGVLVLFGGIAILAASGDRHVQRERNARALERGDLRYLGLDGYDDDLSEAA